MHICLSYAPIIDDPNQIAAAWGSTCPTSV